MTPQEAIKIIKGKICCEEPIQHYCDDSCMYSTKQCAFGLAISVLEKQIPRKPKDIGIFAEIFVCPNCENSILLQPKYCERCGQALDWSDT